MSILMVHDEHTNSLIALSEGIVGGEHTPVRRYQQQGSYLSIDPPANAREHDIDQLQKLGHRLATAQEQNEFTKQQQKATTVQETTVHKGGKK
jgi:hypothetical protein